MNRREFSKRARWLWGSLPAGSVLVVSLWLLGGLPAWAGNCSTVLVKRETVLMLGHNLDESVDFAGFIAVNKRDVYKIGATWLDFRDCDPPLRPTFAWVSRYGSVTWSSQGRDLPDGGVNEAGLAIEEMSLAGHPYPGGGLRPRLFQMQWIQYHLDQWSSVEQVIQSAAVVFPDGWPWHFLVADKGGQCATLEYIQGRLVVHTGQHLPVTALCNGGYAEELANLRQYRDFGGKRTVDLENKKKHSRFVRAAHLLKVYDPGRHPSAVAYLFAMLENLAGPMTRRSYVVDLKSETVHFRTASHPQIRHFSLKAFDFSSDTPVQILDLDTPDTGDVAAVFRNYTPSDNRRIAESWVHHARQMHLKASEAELRVRGLSPENVERYARYPESSLPKTRLDSPANTYGLTPLIWAAYSGDIRTMRDLVGRKAALNTSTHLGVTALMAAAQAGNADATRLLLDQGADIDTNDNSGNSALIVAIAFGHPDIARDLIRKAGHIRRGNRLGLTPLHYATGNGDGETVRLLLEKGADINARDNQGNSALLWAALLGHAQVAAALINAGADVQVKNREGISPWKAAVGNKDRQLQQLLKKAGAKQ